MTDKDSLAKLAQEMREHSYRPDGRVSTSTALLWSHRLDALAAQQVPDGFVLVHKDVVRFLAGKKAIKGHWFGDRVGGKNFWWRSMLPFVPNDDELSAGSWEGK